METIYYTVEKFYTTGGKIAGVRTLNVYKIENNTPILIATIECFSDIFGAPFNADEIEIKKYLEEIGDNTNYIIKQL